MSHKTIVTGKKGTGSSEFQKQMVEELFGHLKNLREQDRQGGPKRLSVHPVKSEFDKPGRPKLLRVKVRAV